MVLWDGGLRHGGGGRAIELLRRNGSVMGERIGWAKEYDAHLGQWRCGEYSYWERVYGCSRLFDPVNDISDMEEVMVG